MKCFKLFPLFVLILLSSENFSQKIKVIEINNLDLNSQYAEIGIKYLKNQRVVFASSKKDKSTNGRDKRNNRNMGLRLYTGSIGTNGKIANVELFSNAENNPISESNITFTSDYKTVYFTRNNYIQDDYRKQFRKDTLDNHILKLFKASLNTDGSLTNIEPLPINNNSYSVTNPQLSPDNKKLFFISDMKSSKGGFDIYEMDIHSDGTYGSPKNLGSRVNSKGSEMFPYVTQDNILYFASNGHGGFGELDVFSYALNDADAKSINLGKPINSNKDDFSLIYNVNNQMGYFASNRKGGNGDADLYSFIAEPHVNEEEELIAEVINTDKTIENSTSSLTEVQTASDNKENEAAIVLNNQEGIPPVLALNEESKSNTTQVDKLNEIDNSDTVTEVSTIEDNTQEKSISNKENTIVNSNNTTEISTAQNEAVEILENNSNSIANTQASQIDLQKGTEQDLKTLESNSNTIVEVSPVQNKAQEETVSIIEDSENNLNTIANTQILQLDSQKATEQDVEILESRTNTVAAVSTATNESQKETISNSDDDSNSIVYVTTQNSETYKKLSHEISQEDSLTYTSTTISQSATQQVEDNLINESNLSEENELVAFKEASKIAEVAQDTLIKTPTDSALKQTTSAAGASTVIVQEKGDKCIQIVEGYIQSNSNSDLSDAKITLYENGKNIGTFDIGTNGKYSFELKCNFHYRVTARLNKFEETYFELRTNRISGSRTTTNIVLEKIPCDILIAGQFRDLNTNTPIANAKLYLIHNNQQVSQTATKKDGSYSFKGMCDESYQINTDKFGYEEGLFSVSQSSVNNTTIRFNGTLTPLACLQVLNGRVTDVNTGEPIVNASVDLYNKNGTLKESAQSNTSGNFHFTVNCDEAYSLKASYKYFETESAEFVATSKSREVHRLDMPLKSMICNQNIEGIVINARTKIPMGNVEVNLLKDGLKVDTKTVSGSGFFSFDILCESNYSITANIKDFHENAIEFTSSDVRNQKIDITLRLETKLDYELVRGEMMILIEPIVFDLDKSNIGEEAAIELSKIVSAMTKNSNITVDIRVHSDSRGPDNYNLTLSEQRAQSIMSYIISRGINSSRLTGKGYGETQLLNKCANGIKCTEAEHLENRRIEFKVNQ